MTDNVARSAEENPSMSFDKISKKEDKYSVEDVVSTNICSATYSSEKPRLERTVSVSDADIAEARRRLQKNQHVVKWFLFQVGILALPVFSDGYNMSVINNSVEGVQGYFTSQGNTLSENDWSTFISMFMAGAMPGSLMGGPLIKIFGPKRVLTYNCFLYFITCILMVIVHTFPMICLARFFLGVALGIQMPAVQILIQECSPPEIRGIVTISVFMFMSLGNTLGFVLSMTSVMGTEELWYWCYALSGVFMAIFFVCTFFACESPRWLLLHGRHEEAEKALRRLRPAGAACDNELEAMQLSAEKDEESLWVVLRMLLTSKQYIRPMIITNFLPLLMQFICGSFIFYYSNILFNQLGFNNGQVVTVLIGVVITIANLCCGMIIERLGRRKTLIFGWCGVVVMAILFTVAALHSDNQAWNIAGMVFFLLYVFIGSAPVSVVFMLSPEMFPNQVRSVAVGISLFTSRLGSFLSAKIFLYIMDAMQEYYFLMFAAGGIVGVVFAYLMVPETQGVPLEAVQSLFTQQAWQTRRKRPLTNKTVTTVESQEI